MRIGEQVSARPPTAADTAWALGRLLDQAAGARLDAGAAASRRRVERWLRQVEPSVDAERRRVSLGRVPPAPLTRPQWRDLQRAVEAAVERRAAAPGGRAPARGQRQIVPLSGRPPPR